MKGAISGEMHDTPAKPGLHSYNFDRRLRPKKDKYVPIRILRTLLLLLGLAGIGYYGYTLADQNIYQAYGNWSFEQQIAGRPFTFTDWLRERTPLSGFMSPPETVKVARPSVATPVPSDRTAAPVQPPATGALLGRVEIGRLNLSQIVREGVDDDVLKRAVGHVPSTALPGQTGNFAIAAHRDTLFRALKDIRKDDQVLFQSAQGNYTYQVVSTRIVRPTDVSVLRPDGDQKLLTMITCYPFYYVGSAPKRFIVQAKLVSTEASTKGAVPAAAAATEEPPPKPVKTLPARKKIVKQTATVKQPRPVRGFAHSAPEKPVKVERKRGFWRRLFHHDST